MADPKMTNPAATAAEMMNDQARKVESTFRDNARDTAERTQAAVQDFGARARTAAEKSHKMFEEAAEFHKGNFEAMMASGRVAAKGVEDLARTNADHARRQLEKTNENVRALAAAKSPTDFFRLQSDFAKSTMDQAVSDFARASESYVKLMTDIAEPLSSRYATMMDKFKSSVNA